MGKQTMNQAETELLRMIREHDSPQEALLTAVGVIIKTLEDTCGC